MNPRRTGAFILAAAAAATLAAASTIDAEPQGHAAAPAAHAVPYNHPVNTPTDATWGSVFSANWR
ncbi:hypothetical protein [Ramlibacter sp. WS9]|uniref:hypothetical protein n=1 Tax=Ramlibacter sp. WS9 TaxID=1882741 RepID=UPI0011445B04|nr:hypothetical protein [Ramlibacter sp. WS9]